MCVSKVMLPSQTQVCVQQTALDMVQRGYDVHVVADGVSSRTQVDRLFALEVSGCGLIPTISARSYAKGVV